MSLILGIGKPDAVSTVPSEPVRSSSLGRRVITPTSDKNSRLVFLTEPTGLAVEQYKILRRRLSNLHPNGGVMLVTSPSPSEGKTLTSANLAWCLAEAGHLTCLVDLDLRAPGLSNTLGVHIKDDGVEDVLSGKRTITDALRQFGEHPLQVLLVRRRRAAVGQLLSTSNIKPLLMELRSLFQWVILDFAPVIPMADVGEILPSVDGALLVVRSGKTGKAMLTPTLDILGSALWGVVLNDAEISGSAYYGSYGSKKR